MPEVPVRLARVLDWLDSIPDRSDRIQALIETADRFRPVPPEVASRPYPEAHKTPACESEVYVFAAPCGDGTLEFHFAVENPQGISAKALAVILSETLSGAPPSEVAAVSAEIVYRIFGGELSMGKSMGLMGMVSMVQNTARSHLARQTGL